MRMHLVPVAAAATIAFATLAFAAPQHANGTIKSYDAKAMSLTLTDGTTYSLNKSFKDPGLKAGEKVSIAWAMQGKAKTAETVKIVK